MSAFNLYGYNYLLIPRFDFLLHFDSGKKLILKDKYMRWIALISFLCGMKSCFHLLSKIYRWSKKLKLFLLGESRIRQIAHGETTGTSSYAIIFGFGDSPASITITKFLSKIGYNLILLNTKANLDIRLQNDMNKIDGLDKLSTCVYQVTYEDFIQDIKNNKFKETMKSLKIHYVFNCSILRVFNTAIPQSDYLFYYNEITSSFVNFTKIFEILSEHFENTKVFFMDYNFKRDDVNHKLLSDMEYSFIMNLKNIHDEKIHSLRSISIKIKHNLLSENNVKKVMMYSDLKDETFEFP